MPLGCQDCSAPGHALPVGAQAPRVPGQLLTLQVRSTVATASNKAATLEEKMISGLFKVKSKGELASSDEVNPAMGQEASVPGEEPHWPPKPSRAGRCLSSTYLVRAKPGRLSCCRAPCCSPAAEHRAPAPQGSPWPWRLGAGVRPVLCLQLAHLPARGATCLGVRGDGW